MARKPSRFDALEVLGREMTPEEIREGVRALARDDRFAAVLAWLVQSQDAWAVEVVEPARAGRAGELASSAGSMGALMRLRHQLQGWLAERADRSASPGD